MNIFKRKYNEKIISKMSECAKHKAITINPKKNHLNFAKKCYVKKRLFIYAFDVMRKPGSLPIFLQTNLYNLLFVATFFVILTASTCFAEDFFVRSDATGLNNGSDWANAYTDFSDILWGEGTGVMGSGDTLYIAGGVYSDDLKPSISGSSATNKVIIKRATVSEHGRDVGWQDRYDDQVVLAGAQIKIYDEDYIDVDGVTEGGFFIQSNAETGQYGVQIHLATGVTIQYFTTNGSINGNDFRGITIRNSKNISIRYGTFEYMPNDAIQLLTVDDIVIEHCYLGPKISSSSRKHADGIEAWVTQNIIFRYNTVDWAGDGVHLGVSTGGGSASGRWDIYNNLFVSKATQSGTSYKTNSTNAIIGPLYFYNNVFYNVYSPFVTYSNTTGVVKNNIFYNNINTNLGTFTHSYNYYETGKDPVESNKQVGGDPFVSSGTYNFNLVPKSTAIDTGIALGSLYDVDYDGLSRSTDALWDMGAYEFFPISGNIPPTPENFSAKRQ